MMDFYDLLDTYAQLNNIDRAEALHLWYRESIDTTDLLKACLEDEGIIGYEYHLINIITALTKQATKDKKYCPWME